MMFPAPTRKHQEISIELATQLHLHLKGKKCKVYIAPFDVRLPHTPDASDGKVDTVVQPGIVVVCDHAK